MDLEAEYNNRAKVPDHPAILDRWRTASAAARDAAVHAELDLAYGPSERQALDIFWPGPARDAPIAIFVHGGYWQGLHRTMFAHLARGLNAHGIAVAMPSYDLCPQVALAVLVEQVRDAAAFLYGRLQRPMLAMGHSAGGHLAAMLLSTDWPARSLPTHTIAAALPISGLFDLPPLTHTSVNVALGLDEAEARRLSPMFTPRPSGRLHAVVGATEGTEYLRQSRGIAEAWGGSWEAVPDANHFTVVEPLADPASRLVEKARELLTN